MVDFCDKCGSIIVGEKGKISKCNTCGFEKEINFEIKSSQKIENKKKMEVIGETSNIHPETSVECKNKNCDSKKAYYFTKQTRSSDEPETQFFECIKCSHKWRDYR